MIKTKEAIESGDIADQDCVFKWFLVVPQLMLRLPQSGGKTGKQSMAHRFQLWKQNKSELVSEWLSDRGGKLAALSRFEERNMKSAEAIKVRRVLRKVAKGEIRKGAAELRPWESVTTCCTLAEGLFDSFI